MLIRLIQRITKRTFYKKYRNKCSAMFSYYTFLTTECSSETDKSSWTVFITLGSSSTNFYNCSWSYIHFFMHNVSLRWVPSFNSVFYVEEFFQLTYISSVASCILLRHWKRTNNKTQKTTNQTKTPNKPVSTFLDICGLISLYCVKNYLIFLRMMKMSSF